MGSTVTAVFTDLQTSLSYTDAAVGVLYVDLKATNVRLDPFLKFSRYSDAVTVADTALVMTNFGRAFDDDLSFIDEIILSIDKVLSDGLAIDDLAMADALVVEFVATKSNVLAVADALALLIAKPLTDSISFSDLVDILLVREVLDIITMSDTLLAEISYVPTAIINAGALNTFVLNE